MNTTHEVETPWLSKYHLDSFVSDIKLESLVSEMKICFAMSKSSLVLDFNSVDAIPNSYWDQLEGMLHIVYLSCILNLPDNAWVVLNKTYTPSSWSLDFQFLLTCPFLRFQFTLWHLLGCRVAFVRSLCHQRSLIFTQVTSMYHSIVVFFSWCPDASGVSKNVSEMVSSFFLVIS